tara:strand:+ start:19684 stop:21009 length:1326 start_codon:yes stop_codon:yes gene_type:complete
LNHFIVEVNQYKNLIVLKERAFLVGVITGDETYEKVKSNLNELSLLADTAGAVAVELIISKINRISPKYFVGKGKAEQIINQAKALNVNLIIFDDDLSPTQSRNFHKISDKIKIIDRTGLILDIFTNNAKTTESKTQVELARLQYILPRLTRMWTHLERQMGGIGTRAGAGETQIEIDRRLIRTKISKLKRQIKSIEKERITQSIRRKEKFRVSLVGYTNAGKSTLLNTLTGAQVYAKNKLFATLDTTVKSLKIEKNNEILLSDSVGFIRKLPHDLVASFKSTLKEVVESDLLLIVVDSSSQNLDDELLTVKEVLNSIKVKTDNSLIVLNKIDLVKSSKLNGLKNRFPEGVFISAKNRLMINHLLNEINSFIKKNYITYNLTLKFSQIKFLDKIFNLVDVIKCNYEKDFVSLKVRGKPIIIKKIISDIKKSLKHDINGTPI